MSNRTKKYLWPASFVMSLALVGVLAAFLAIAMTGSNSAEAHGPCDFGTMTGADFAACVASGGDDPHTHDDPTPTAAPMPAIGGTLESSSDSPSAGVKLTLTMADPGALMPGSSVELHLEDEFQVGDLDKSKVYFIGKTAGRVYVTDPIVVDDDNHFGGDDDWAIQVFVPDMNPGNDDGFTSWSAADAMGLKLVFDKAGIQNPSEAGTASVGFSVLAPGADNNSDPTYSTHKGQMGDAAMQDGRKKVSLTMNDDTKAARTADVGLVVIARIGLSDDNNSRGYELTVTGSGFNNGTSAAVHVLSEKGMTTKPTCSQVLGQGTRVGIATVGSDDKAAVTFEVTVPTFLPGKVNWICMVDGEGRMATHDVEDFELEPSIRVVPSSASAGDTITVFAQDYSSGSFEQLKIAGQVVWPESAASAGNYVSVDSSSIGRDGSATATFDLPGSLSGNALEGTVRIDATWGGDPEDTKITIVGSQLSLSKGEALSNELITITGDGFGGEYIAAADITIDGVAMMVDEASTHRQNGMDVVDVSNSGQFVASVVLWPAPGAANASNPTLIAGTHTIDVQDNAGFSGSAVISIPEATLSVTPDVAGPRDVITIRGENWPIDNVDGAAPDAVDVKISDGSRTRRYSAFADSAGRFTIEHRVASDVAIPSTNQVRAEMGTDIVKIGSFEVPASVINVEPGTAQPGDTISLSVDGMPVYQQVDRVEIGGRSVLPVGNFSTDRNGSVSVDGVLVPGLDPGTYSVLLDVENTIAIGSLDILSEGPIGTDTAVADAVAPLGDSLAAVFHFNNVNKDWAFYDPRPEFAELNTLTSMINGEAYWVLTTGDVEDVVLNNRSRSLSCAGDDCWNLVIW